MDATFSHKCPTCNANIPFDPKSQLWVCDYCGGRFTAEQINSFEQNNKDANNSNNDENNTHNFTFESAIPKAEEKKEDSSNQDLDIYTCSNCGAQVITDQNTVATFCVYCGGYTLAKDRLKGKFEPNYIIPFHTTKDEARQEYIKSINSKKFVPTSFKDPKNIEKITGVYIPFWSYDCDMRVQKSGTGERIRAWFSGDYEYIEHKVYNFSRDMTAVFDDVPVDGSKKFDDDLMDSIEPFDYSKKVPFDPRYLSGFLAEKYDVDKDEAYKRAQLRMANTANKEVDKTINFASKSITTNYISENKGEVLYWLLPVWMLNTKYENKTYEFAMNGVSKKVVGRFPTDKGKVFLHFLLLLLGIFLLVYFIESITLYEKPKNNRYSLFTSTAYADTISNIDYDNDSVLNRENISQVINGEFGVPQTVTEQKVYDYADLLTDTEESNVFQKIAQYIDNHNMDMGVVTINQNPKKSAMVYADDFYDYNHFGTDDMGSGLLLLIDMDTREIWISTKGNAILVYDDERLDKMLDAVYEHITVDDYKAVMAFIDLANKYASAGIPESNSNYEVVKDDSIPGMENGEYQERILSYGEVFNPRI